ncbi:MAG TPA: hypothetical protein VMU30_03775 [Bacteroidota bacterium]|nr:hypothetical protein [Bacteroidota bacterium]
MQKKKLRAYLSGGMEYAKGEGADWRLAMENWLDGTLCHTAYNPNKESEALLKKRLPKGNFRSLKTADIKRYTEIVQRMVEVDSNEIAKRSDYIICLWDKSAQQGAGTKGELTLAKYFHKPVYFVTQMHHEKIPGWVLGCISKQFKTFDALKFYLMDRYLSVNKIKNRGKEKSVRYNLRIS